MNFVKSDLVRIVILDVSKPLCTVVYDEAILPVSQATEFVKEYIDISKYRIVTV